MINAAQEKILRLVPPLIVGTREIDEAVDAVIFTQGDPCESVLYIQKGGVKLSVLSKTGRQAVVAILGPGEFFGEDRLLELIQAHGGLVFDGGLLVGSVQSRPPKSVQCFQ